MARFLLAATMIIVLGGGYTLLRRAWHTTALLRDANRERYAEWLRQPHSQRPRRPDDPGPL